MSKKSPYTDYGITLLAAFQSIEWGARQIKQHFQRENIKINDDQISSYLTGKALPTLEIHGIFVDILRNHRAQDYIINALNQRYAQASPARVHLLDRVAGEASLSDRIAQSKNFVELLDALIEEKFPGDTEHSYLQTRQALASGGYLSHSGIEKYIKLGVKADLDILNGVIDLLKLDNKDRSFTYQYDHNIIAETTAERLVRYYLAMKIIIGRKEIGYSSSSGGDYKVKTPIFPVEYLAQTAQYAKEEHNFPLLINCLKHSSEKENNAFFMPLLKDPKTYLLGHHKIKMRFINDTGCAAYLDIPQIEAALQSIFGTKRPAWAKGNEICNTAAHFLENCMQSDPSRIHYVEKYKLAETQWPEPTPQIVQAIAERLTGIKAIAEEKPHAIIDTTNAQRIRTPCNAANPSIKGA